ncbi:ke2 family protein [Nannochloropsis gaditana CCMP526]|uniref:Ke2 family protein n=1 Tax=Nannochloropsis gaditana TaxID=72520 RepID=W7TIU2_9STRA|nr:ke2 family protein [Nannochloropsis gaditana CCMP526]EKU20332.1 ke2 family protein [Nannochloropsis gaditana CCMP526]EWM25937.1 ke2 family protein [Nannochloropsis gaditana]|eukprot:XP_005856039.1 ke2 family protein [Nannochloropsis gaditana CCMP526]
MSASAMDEALASYKALEADTQELMARRQVTLQQANENGMVQQELDGLEAGENVYKMMGPVLLRVELEDAKQNVAKRLDLIKSTMEDFDQKIQGKQKDAEELGTKIMTMQQELQAKTADAAKAAAQDALKGVMA